MGKQEIHYREKGGLGADEVQRLVLKVAPQYFRGDSHQREMEASRIVFGFLDEHGPFDSLQSALMTFVIGKGAGKSHVSGSIDGELKSGYSKSGTSRKRSHYLK
ncbi:MAG: hypothetical protein WCG44_01860 [bacterium]